MKEVYYREWKPAVSLLPSGGHLTNLQQDEADSFLRPFNLKGSTEKSFMPKETFSYAANQSNHQLHF